MKTNVQIVKRVLTYTFGLVPIIAGLDKFTNLLTEWSHYISGNFAKMLPLEVGMFMMAVGVIEIIAGILVFLKPKIGAMVVMAWLVAIGLTLILEGQYFDIAVRDFVMAVGAFSLVKLTEENPQV